MNAYFSTPARLAALDAAARAWLGTRFMPNAAVRGEGVSCQKLVGSLYVDAGFLPAGFQIPEGPMEWGNAQTRSLIGEFMAAQSHLFTEIIPANQWQPGDMAGFKLGGCVHHCGVVINADGTFIHALRHVNTAFSNLRDATYLRRLEKIWRPIQ